MTMVAVDPWAATRALLQRNPGRWFALAECDSDDKKGVAALRSRSHRINHDGIPAGLAGMTARIRTDEGVTYLFIRFEYDPA